MFEIISHLYFGTRYKFLAIKDHLQFYGQHTVVCKDLLKRYDNERKVTG